MTFSLLGLVTYNLFVVYLNLSGSGIDLTSFTQMSILVMIAVNLVGFFVLIFLHFCTHP